MIGASGGRFEVELRKRIGDEIEELKSHLAAGEAIKDYAQYQNYVGKLTALKLVITDYMDDALTALNKE